MQWKRILFKLKNWYPLWVTLLVYWLLTFALIGFAVMGTRGHFGYPLDDTYIHMAIGKHFVIDGFWGVSLTGFSSSTSSPLWTYLIALSYRLFGVNDWTPLALALVSGTCIILLCYLLLRTKTKPFVLLISLLLIVLLIPLPVITSTGMEHVLHGFLSIWLIYCAVNILSEKESTSWQLALLLLLSALVTIVRYEGVFLIFVISFLFVISRRFYTGFLVALAGLLPVTLYGLFSISQGWYFFPNSILLKGNFLSSPGGISAFILHFPRNLRDAPHVLAIFIACVGVYLVGEERNVFGKRERYLIWIFVMITLFHLQFASVGWFYRYEAYLLLAGIVILFDMLSPFIPTYLPSLDKSYLSKYLALGLMVFFLLFPSLFRAGGAFRNYPVAVVNIYEQQYQMGRFFQTYYQGKSVAANDIGAINFLAEINVLDLFGLGNMDVARGKLSGEFDQDLIADVVNDHKPEIMIIYNSWFEGYIPTDWIEIGRWQISNNIVCGSETISFYVPTASLQAEAINNMMNFSDLLPTTIRQSGTYRDS